MKRNSQQGVALVVTLILLSVITFMAVTFLVVSRKEASQVNTLTQQSNAKFGNDAANEEAKAQIIAQMLATGNGLNFGLLVSTNFQSGTNFVHGSTALTNVSYTFDATSVLPGDLYQMLNNQLILPRPPVYIVTNKLVPNKLDFRYYLDLNRNGRFDTNGLVLEVDTNGAPILDPKTGQPVPPTVRIGDPEWVGILNHPDQRHSSSNFYIARYCFIALPIGNSLDLNYIHNQAKQISPVSEGFLRNQGVGSWEINLAAFLHTLNTNYWSGYLYVTNNNGGGGTAFPSTGNSFLDAASILQFRYNTNFYGGGQYGYQNLRSFKNIFTGNANASTLFGNDFIDGYSYGPLMTGLFQTNDPDGGLVTRPWSGDNALNPHFTTQDLFNPAPILNTFVTNLTAAGKGRGTDDRYTYYRLLSQLSFASAPESSVGNTNVTAPYPGYYPFTSRLNLNYCNVGTNNATNFVPWTPLQFFTNCANRLLANAGYNFTVTNIPIFPASSNIYTPALHRLLQLAANIYDASTYKTDLGTNFDYPSVFRPMFATRPIPGGTMVYISGYTNDPPDLTPTAAYNNVPFSMPEDISTIISKTASPTTDPKLNIYGIPWVIGARTGFPNFNEFSMASVSQITRKLQVLLPSSPKPNTNVQYTIGISNVLGIEAWNSYASTYPRQVQIMGVATLSMALSNLQSGVLPAAMLAQTNLNGSFSMFFGKATPIIVPANSWTGFTKPNLPDFDTNSFKLPLLTNVIFLPDLAYHPFSSPILSGGTNFDVTGPNGPVPHFVLNVTNRMQFVMVDPSGRVIDYVSFGGLNFTRDLTAELQGTDNGGPGGVWLTNLQNNVMAGVQNQLSISRGINVGNFTDTDWYADQLQPTSKSAATKAFSDFLNNAGSVSNAMQAPYTPTRKAAKYYTWQANDPLVHYDLGLAQYDLSLSGLLNTNLTNQDIGIITYPSPQSNSTVYLPSLRHVNTNYYPWNNTGNLLGSRADTANSQNLAIKDSMITRSDAWQFPTNRFPNIGWLAGCIEALPGKRST